MESSLQRRKHIHELDYIRAISAIFIVLFHYTTQYDTSFGHAGGWPIAVPWGSRAVSTFFLLTGYLTVCHYKDGGFSFLYKRFCRLWPAFAVCVLVTSGFMAVLLPERLRSVTDILLNLTMFPNYLGAKLVDGVYWTLPVEIGFYVWIMLMMIGRKRNRLILWLYSWVLVSIGVSLLCFVGITPLPVKLLRMVFLTEHSTVFVIGAAIFLVEGEETSRKTVIPLFALCLVGAWLVKGLAVTVWIAVWGLLIWAVTSGKLHFALKPSNPLHKCLLFVSKISYTLYLLHQFIGFAIIKKIESMGGHSQLWIVVPMGVSLLLAVAVHFWVEVPAGNALLRLQANRKKVTQTGKCPDHTKS